MYKSKECLLMYLVNNNATIMRMVKKKRTYFVKFFFFTYQLDEGQVLDIQKVHTLDLSTVIIFPPNVFTMVQITFNKS